MSKKRWLLIVVAIIVAAAAVLTVVMSQRSGSNRDVDATSTLPPTSTNKADEQRHWPRGPEGKYFDDSQYEPGQWGTDRFGRGVWVPVDPNGDIQGQPKQAERLLCDTTTEPLSGQIQYVHGRYVLMTKDQGPGAVNDRVLTDYAKTAPGAATAFINALAQSIGTLDPIAHAAWSKLFKSEEAERRAAQGIQAAGPQAEIFLLPDAYRVVGCGGDTVTVEIAINAQATAGDAPRWMVFRAPLRWDEASKLWIVTMSKSDQRQSSQPAVSDLSGWIKVEYQ